MSAAFLWLLTSPFAAGDDASKMSPRGSGSGGEPEGELLPHAHAWLPGDYAWDAQAMVRRAAAPRFGRARNLFS